MRPLTTPGQWDTHWERFPLPYRVNSRSYFSYRCDRLFQSIVPRGGRHRFIDVGCGVGQWLIYFHETFGYEVAGIDNSAAACRLARRNLELANVPGEIIEGDATTVALEPASFDVVYSGGVIEHFDDPLPLVLQMSRLVKPGGLYIIFVPNLGSIWRHVRERLDPVSFEGHRRITTEQLEVMLKQSGMDDVNVRFFGSIRLPHVSRRGLGQSGVQVSTPLWLVLRTLDRGCTSVQRRLGFQPESSWFSPEIVAIARAGSGDPDDDADVEPQVIEQDTWRKSPVLAPSPAHLASRELEGAS